MNEIEEECRPRGCSAKSPELELGLNEKQLATAFYLAVQIIIMRGKQCCDGPLLSNV